MSYIYLLLDPCNWEPRYVGKTDDPHGRLSEHVAEARCPRHSADNIYKANWIKTLLRAGVRPEMQVVEEVEGEDWAVREIWWISYGRECGWRLTNLSAGGDGPGKISEEAKERLRDYNRTRIISDEMREKWRQAASGKSPSEKTRQKLSAAGRGRRHSTESRQKMSQRISAAKKGRPQSMAQKEARRDFHARNPDVVRGENNPGAKLTREQVLMMREEYARGGIGFRRLAKKYGVTTMTAHRAVTGKSWSHV